MNTTLVINRKGGAGKTTLSINLASYFAANGVPVAIMDYDPQGSSLNWLKSRPDHLEKIHAANAAPTKFGQLRSFEMYVPSHIEQLIIDAPGGATVGTTQEMLLRTHCVLIPVTPSSIDVHATANFIRDLLLSGIIRLRNIRIAVVANRVRRSMPVYQPLERFLKCLDLPLVARLMDSDTYLRAAETGFGIFEMEAGFSEAECKQFMPVVDWVTGQRARDAVPPERNVYPINRGQFA